MADAYDALTSWRPYRESIDRKAAFDELHQSVKKGLYDPQVEKALIRVMG